MKVFHTLKEAIEFSMTDFDLAVFSKENGHGGKRHFLVCERESFWDIYRRLPSKKHYEVILPGVPCKLFFDLDVDIALNKDLDGNILTERLISLVINYVLKKHNMEIRRSSIIVLDSTNKNKFSKHLIFRNFI